MRPNSMAASQVRLDSSPQSCLQAQPRYLPPHLSCCSMVNIPTAVSSMPLLENSFVSCLEELAFFLLYLKHGHWSGMISRNFSQHETECKPLSALSKTSVGLTTSWIGARCPRGSRCRGPLMTRRLPNSVIILERHSYFIVIFFLSKRDNCTHQYHCGTNTVHHCRQNTTWIFFLMSNVGILTTTLDQTLKTQTQPGTN